MSVNNNAIPYQNCITAAFILQAVLQVCIFIISSAPAAVQSAVSSIIRNTVMPVLLIPFSSRWFSFSGPRPADPYVFC